MAKILILGMGNSILSDDSAGLVLAEKVFEMTQPGTADLQLAETGGMNLVDIMAGYDVLIVIDSIKTGTMPAGTVVEIDPGKGTGSHRILSSHGISFFDAVALGKKLGTLVPEKIIIFGIEIDDNLSFGTQLTPKVAATINGAAKQISEKLIETGLIRIISKNT